MLLVFPVFTAKAISLEAFNSTSAFLSIVLIPSPIKFNMQTKNLNAIPQEIVSSNTRVIYKIVTDK